MTEDDASEGRAEAERPLYETVLNSAFGTLFFVLVLSAVLIGYLFMRMPFLALRVSYDLGSDANAYAYTRKFLRREAAAYDDIADAPFDSAYVSGLIYAAELGEKMLDKDVGYAAEVAAYTQAYAFLKEGDKRSAMLNSYYTDAPAALRVAGYSYRDFVYSLNYYARVLNGEADKLLYKGELIETARLGGIVAAMDIESDAEDYATLLHQMTRSLQAGGEAAAVALAARFDEYLEYSLAVPGLKRLYLIESALNFSETLYAKKGDGSFEREAGGMPLSRYYYTVLLYEYIKNDK